MRQACNVVSASNFKIPQDCFNIWQSKRELYLSTGKFCSFQESNLSSCITHFYRRHTLHIKNDFCYEIVLTYLQVNQISRNQIICQQNALFQQVKASIDFPSMWCSTGI